MIKKYYRIFFKYISYLFLKFLKIFLYKSNFKILPPIADKNEFNYDYSPSNRRVVLRKDNNKFGKVIFDSSLFETELCHLGKKYFTNKSGLNLNGHRSGYTGLYFLLFFHLKFKKCAIAEIGIAKNASTKLWRSFFSKAMFEDNGVFSSSVILSRSCVLTYAGALAALFLPRLTCIDRE